MAGGIATIDKHSMLGWRSWHWQHHLIQNSRALYMTQATLNTGTLSAVGGTVTIDKWMQEPHGPTLTVNDEDGAGLSLSVEIGGRDQFGEYRVTKMAAMTDAVSTTVTTGSVTNISVVDGGASYDIYRLGAGTWSALGFVIGDTIVPVGFANAANNITRIVTGISGADLSVNSTTLVVEAAGATVTVSTPGTGTLWQCPQPYSWLDYIKVTAISGAAASDTLDVGIFRFGSNTGVWYGVPFDMAKSGLPVASLYSNQNNSLLPFQDTSLNYNALRIDISVSAILDVTTIFDPRKVKA